MAVAGGAGSTASEKQRSETQRSEKQRSETQRSGARKLRAESRESGAAPRTWIGGLDGLRAIAVIAVVLFHLDAAYLPGGFLGVDLFFVLSGYLITRLLLAEWRANGRIALGAFYLRRARRLLPAVAALLAVVSIAGALVWTDQRPVLLGGAASSALYVTNWWMIADQQSYFVATGRPPMLQHLWSLAIEEQFYLLWAPAAVLLLSAPWVLRTRLGRRWGRAGTVAAVAGVLALTSTAVMAAVASASGVPFQADSARVYFGTDTHAMGLLLGAAAGALAGRSARRASRMSEACAIVALAGLTWFWWTVDEYQPWLYRGGFALFALVALVAVTSAARPGSRVGSVLDLAPLRWIGRRSYGIYLWHWPVAVVTRPLVDVTGPTWLIDPARAGLAVALAALSYRYLEEPIRRGRFRVILRGISLRLPAARQVLVPAGAAACVAVLVGATFMTPPTGADLAGASAGAGADAGPKTGAGPNPAGVRTGDGSSGSGGPLGGLEGGGSTIGGGSSESSGEVHADEPWTWGEDFASAADDDVDPDAYIDEQDGAAGDGADGADHTVPDGAAEAEGARSDHGTGTEEADGDGLGKSAGTDPPTDPAGDPSTETTADSPARPDATSHAVQDPAPSRSSPPDAGDTAAAEGGVINGDAERPAKSGIKKAAKAAAKRKGPGTVSAFGDSVLLGAAPALEASVPRMTLDAAVGRQSWDTLDEVQKAARGGAVGKSVLIHTGNNGIIPPQQLTATLKALRGCRVVLVNTHVDRTWSRPNNKTIAAAQKAFKNITVVDWNKAAREHPRWFGPDGMHVNGTGAKAYAKLVLRALS